MQRLLTRLQHYIKTDIRYILHNGSWLSATKLVGLSSSFISSVVLANMLPESTYGEYRYVLTLLVLLTLPTLGGVDIALTRAIAKGKEEVFKTALCAKIKWGFLGSLASITLAGYYFFQGDVSLAGAFLVAALFIPIMEPANLFLAHLAGKKQFKTQTIYQFVVRAVSTLTVLGTVFVTQNVIVLLLVYFFSYTILRIFFLWKVQRTLPKDGVSDSSDTVTYGTHLTIQNIPTVFTKTLDSLLVFHFAGATALAGYALARIPIKQAQNVLNSINVLALPGLSSRKSSDVQATLPRKITLLYMLVIPIVGIYWSIAVPFFTLLYPNYTDFIFISQVSMLQLLSLPISLLETALVSFGERKRLYIYTLTVSILRLILLFVCIFLYGVIGASVALLATSTIGSLLLIYLFFTHKNTPDGIQDTDTL